MGGRAGRERLQESHSRDPASGFRQVTQRQEATQEERQEEQSREGEVADRRSGQGSAPRGRRKKQACLGEAGPLTSNFLTKIICPKAQPTARKHTCFHTRLEECTQMCIPRLHLCTHTHMHAYMCTYPHVCMHMSAWMHKHAHTHTSVYTSPCKHTHTHDHEHAYAHPHAHMHAFVYMCRLVLAHI